MLSGCASSPSSPAPAGLQLPALPAALEADCADPGVRAGVDARAELARNRAWAKCERGKHRSTVAFYNDLRAGLGKR